MFLCLFIILFQVLPWAGEESATMEENNHFMAPGVVLRIAPEKEMKRKQKGLYSVRILR
jgi:hypothetical protein